MRVARWIGKSQREYRPRKARQKIASYEESSTELSSSSSEDDDDGDDDDNDEEVDGDDCRGQRKSQEYIKSTMKEVQAQTTGLESHSDLGKSATVYFSDIEQEQLIK